MSSQSTTTNDANSPEEPMSKGIVFAIVAVALAMTTVDTTIVATALHAIGTGLHTSINWVGWTITVYSFGFVLMLPVSGKLCERYGNRRVFLVSVASFTAVSLLCGLATNIYVLIALRALQAVAGAGFTPSATGIIVNHFGNSRDRAVGLFGSIFPAGGMVGPILGGFIVSYWNWHGVFLVNVPFGIVITALALRYIPRDLPQNRVSHMSMDVVGMGLFGVGLLAGMLMVTFLGNEHGQLPLVLIAVCLAVAVGAFWGFFRHVNSQKEPFLEPLLIYGPNFGAVNLVNIIYEGVAVAVVALVPLYAINRYGLSALVAGTLLIGEGVAAVVVSILATMALRRTGYRRPLYLGSVFIIAGILLLAINPPASIAPYLWITCSAFLIGVGVGINNPASRNAGLQLAVHKSAIIAGLRTASLQTGSIITISVITAVMANFPGDPGIVQGWAYAVTAALLVLFLPIISRVPDHRGSW